MAFENISKGEFYTIEKSVINNGEFFYTATTNKEEDAEFIAFCLSLQQRYDISKLEEAVKLFELLLEENMCSIAADGKINNLLNHIKK